MVEYSSANIYINSTASYTDRVCKIDAIIDALFATALSAAATDSFSEYVLDDGQTKIRATYKGTEAIFNSINTLERQKQYYVNKINGRVFRLVDGSSFRR